MAAREKKANRPNRIDSVRASRDGHQFHEAWVARRALGLLLPRFDLYGIAVEGLSEEDEEGAPAAAVEIADATFYHGNGTSFESCSRIEVAQFKYSISKAGTPPQFDFEQTTVRALQICRAALTYAREMVLWRERRLHANSKRRAPMYVPPHHEIRGFKTRMRQR